jgi:hypothetical protein
LHHFAFTFAHIFLFVLSFALVFIQYQCAYNICASISTRGITQNEQKPCSLGQPTHRRTWTCHISKRPE